MPPEEKQELLTPRNDDLQISSVKSKYQPLFNSSVEQSENNEVQAALNSLDEFFATPMANVKAIGEDFDFKVYDVINASRYVLLWDSLLTGIGFFTAGIGAYVSGYRKLRNLEKNSHFFYFERLTEAKKNKEILELMGESRFDYAVLRAAAHFYSPDISKFVAWKRRTFCSKSQRKELERLQDLWSKKGKNKQKILEEVFLEIIKKVVLVLNKKNTHSYEFEFEPKGYAIELAASYKEKLFLKTKNTWSEIQVAKNPSFGHAFLQSLGETSFIYWLAVFLFSFIPVGIVAGTGVAFPPLVIAGGFFIFKLGVIAYKALTSSIDESQDIQNIERQKKEIFVRKLVELSKRETFVELSTSHIPSVNFIGSKLRNELQDLLSKRRFSKIHAALQGFVEGCFFTFFVAWVLSDLAKVLVAATLSASLMGPGMPIAIGIAIATLILGVGYGIYLAINAVSVQEARYEELIARIKCLEEENVQLPDLSLQAYDRLLRRYSLEEPRLSLVKKVLNRVWVIIKRLGTGSLFFRLCIWGTITACTVVPAALVAPITIPFIIGCAAIFATCYYRAYNVDSQLKQAENILDFHCTRLIAEKDQLSVSTEENTKTGLVSRLQAVENVDHGHLGNKVPQDAGKITQLIEVSAQKVDNDVASIPDLISKPANEPQKSVGSIENVDHGHLSNKLLHEPEKITQLVEVSAQKFDNDVASAADLISKPANESQKSVGSMRHLFFSSSIDSKLQDGIPVEEKKSKTISYH